MTVIAYRSSAAVWLAAATLLAGCGHDERTGGTVVKTVKPVEIERHVNISSPREISATFSIAAADPESGVCGAAVASKYPAVGKVVPYVRAGIGAFCTQHFHRPEFGERALDLLAAGKTPGEVLTLLVADDPEPGQRQLAIVDMRGRAANCNPYDAPRESRWWGGATGRFYACQGNTLTGRAVVAAMAESYEETKGSLADRLMAALVAADAAGGDHRGRLAAGIRLCKTGVKDYWFELHVDRSDDAVRDLLKAYVAADHPARGEWPAGKALEKKPADN